MNDILMDAWYAGAISEEVEHQLLGRVVCNSPLLFYRTQAGEVVVLEDLCSHRRAPLSAGRLKGDRVQCVYHGLEFEPDGRCALIPCQANIPAASHVRRYPNVEKEGTVWVWMGDPKLADETRIPPRPWVNAPGWNSKELHYYHVPAKHVLMTDNLLDLGHVAFLHADTIGFDGGRLKEDPLACEVIDTCIRNTRVIPGIPPSPVVQSWGKFKGLITRTSLSEWRPPCYTNILFRNEDDEKCFDLRIDHMITPETDRSMHYWVRVSRNFNIEDADLTQKLYDGHELVHAQDLAIVTAQQKMWDLVPARKDMMIAQDRGLVAAHRVLERLAAEERERRLAKPVSATAS